MKILLLRCAICDHWFSPHAHAEHCPACGSFATPVGRKRYTMHVNRLVEIVRGIPRQNLNTKRLVAMAQVLASGKRIA